jgi:hypothetical protein
MTEHCGTERRQDDQLLGIFQAQMKALQGDLFEVKTAIKDVAAALTKLALVEERQTQSAAALERAFSAIEKLDKKLDAVAARVLEIEKREPSQTRAAEWVDRAVWAAAAGMVMMAASKLGMLG